MRASPTEEAKKRQSRCARTFFQTAVPGPILHMCWFLKFGKVADTVGGEAMVAPYKFPPAPLLASVAIAFEEDDTWAGAAAELCCNNLVTYRIATFTNTDHDP